LPVAMFLCLVSDDARAREHALSGRGLSKTDILVAY
jgi:hypothetical protein